MQRLRILSMLCVALSLALAHEARAAWTPDGVAISPPATNYKPFIVPDGAGGTLVTWYGGAGSDIFAQRLRSDGSIAPGWPTAAPLTVCGATGLQEQPVLVSDGAGGALLFWQDARNGGNYDIFGQHISATGQVFTSANANWVANGVPIADAAGNQYTPQAVSDGAGGAIVVWQDGRLGAGNYDIYAQRVDGDGNLQWVPAGQPVCTAPNNQINPTIVSDGAGGAFIAWQDYRNAVDYDIYVQHLDPTGALVGGQWVANGLGICLARSSQFYPTLASDGSGGAFVAWQDSRTGSDNHIYAQHVSRSGALVSGWPVDGTPVCQASFSQYFPVVTGDGAGGAFFAWQDYRTGTTNHIFGQHLTGGNVGLVTDGVPISLAPNGQFSPQIAYDGRSGAFVTWYDSRSGSSNDIYVQRMDTRGLLNPGWDANGLPVCLATNTQQFPVVATDGAGTATLTWQDLRSGGQTTAAIFANQELGVGTVGVEQDPAAPLVSMLGAPRPNPTHGSSLVELTLPVSSFVRAEIIDLSGRRIATLASETFSAGTHSLAWDGRTARGGPAAPGVYLVRVKWSGFESTRRIVRVQ